MLFSFQFERRGVKPEGFACFEVIAHNYAFVIDAPDLRIVGARHLDESENAIFEDRAVIARPGITHDHAVLVDA